MTNRFQNLIAAAPEPVFAPALTGTLQRQCDCGNHTMSSACDDCAKNKGSLQRKASNNIESSAAPSIVHEVLRSTGHPLDAATRAFMEPRFGHDFSHVRVHTDAKAAASARGVNALAYTVGQDIVLGDGANSSNPGEQPKLLAHELAHVVQQRVGHTMLQGRMMVGEAENLFEREADQMADRVLRTPVSGPNQPPSFTSTNSLSAASKQTGSRAGMQREAHRNDGGSQVGAPQLVDQALSSPGQPLDSETGEFMESRFGSTFQHVRVHTDARAAEAARSVNARAFTLGRDIVFDANEFAPRTESGRLLLAHELTHVLQQGNTSVGPVIQRKDRLWEKVKVTRELKPDKIPKSFNYELVNHRLIAHTFSTSDIDEVVKFVSILGLSFKIVINESDLKAKLTEARKDAPEAEMRDFDVTPFLPESLQRYMTELETYYDAFRKYLEKKGFTPDDIFDKFGKLIEKAQTKEEKAELESKQREEIDEWYRGMPNMPDEFHAACHQFVTLETAGSVSGVEPGSYVGQTYGDPLEADLDAIVASLQSSLKGKGPYRPVAANDVQIGDIAVFLAGKTIKGEDSPVIEKGGAIHSAMVIRVKGTQVELLEKTNPHEPMATRTVKEVLNDYSSDKAYVKYLAPTLKGMPATSPSDIGNAPPSKSFTTLSTRAPEDTHVLFKQNTAVTLPHEDRKLFGFIARVTTKAEVNVHGYASEEGDPTYNLNLSAHRAVAVGDALQPQLPADSKVELFAHGESEEFGSHEEARRAGIELRNTTAVPSTQPSTQKEESE
jgi:outer membrane protein OmpA-like peptidoglycan-associated protein